MSAHGPPPATWVLLRGLTREAAHWGDFPAALQARWPTARVLTLDLPGCGTEHRQRSPDRIEGMVDALRAQLKTRQVATPVHLLALSLGGMVAVDWARRYPGELAGVVLVNTSLARFSRVDQRLRPANLPALLRLLLAARRPAAREAIVLRLTSNRADEWPAVVSAWADVRRARPVSTMNALRQLLAAARYRAPRDAPAVPALVLTSAGDRLVDPACSRRLAAAWSWPLAEHPGAGHDLPLDDGAWVIDQVVDQVAAQAAAQAARWRMPG
ncbi:MAG: alpha/beta hydrolase [Burkholderiaceae bacterium]